jgi:hypothetical protein
VAQQSLHAAQVGAVREQVGRVGVTHGMRCDLFARPAARAYFETMC